MPRIIKVLAPYVFPASRTVKLLEASCNATNSGNLVGVTINVIFTVIECCNPPPIRLIAHCLATR